MLETHYRKVRKYCILPNLITYSNMGLGLMAILISNSTGIGKIKTASMLIIFAALTDKLDGYVARRLNMTSEFGKQLDSLCDLVSFGVAPMVIGWNLGMEVLGILGFISCIFFIGSGIFRLARFNLQEDKGFIVGLPITIAGAIMVLKYILDLSFRINKSNSMILSYENIILIIILSISMVSSIKVKKPKFVK